MARKSKNELDKEFINACESGDLSRVKYLLTSKDLKDHADIHVDYDGGFRVACFYGHLEIIKYLLTSPDLKEHVDIHAMDDYGFRWACKNGHLDIVKCLLASPDLKEHADIHATNDCGLVWACQYGQMSVVQYLIEETQSYSIDNIRKIEFDENSKISKNDALDIAKTRHLKNQLTSEVLLKNNRIKNKLMI